MANDARDTTKAAEASSSAIDGKNVDAPEEGARSSFVARLRSATSADHEALDGSLALVGQELTRARYADFLRGSLLVVEPLERALAAWPGVPPEPVADRAARLREDLAALNVAQNELPVFEAVPVLDERAKAFGAAYVMKGSSLGGLFLARAVGDRLALDGRALRYLSLRGGETKAVWRSFLERLESWASGATEAEREEACQTARACFAAYARAFQRAGAVAPQPPATS